MTATVKAMDSQRWTCRTQVLQFKFAPFLRQVLVNGAMGVIAVPEGKVFSLTGFTVIGGKIVAMDILADPERLSRIDLTALD